MSKTINRLFVGAVITYVVVVVLLLLASYLVPLPEARGILRSGFGLLLFPALVLLPVSALLRRWRLVLLLVPGVAAWLIIYGVLLLPRAPVDLPEAGRFSVLTFNVQTASDNLDSLAALIENADADIVALQELSQPAADFLEQHLAERYPHQALYPQPNPHWGQGVFSRFPIGESEFWRNESIDVAQGHMWARVQIAGQPVTVFSTHPVPPLSFEKGIALEPHSREINILLERASQHDTPLLLVGDFNMTQLMDEYVRVTEQYVDTFRQVGSPGLGFSFPAGQRLPLPPVVRIDYIFHSEHFQGIHAYPLSRSSISDHLPFWGEFVLTQ